MGRSNLLTANIVSSANGTVALDAEGLHLSEPHDGEKADNVTVMIRPERIQIDATGKTGIVGATTVPGRILKAVYLGSTVHLDVKVDDGPKLQVMRQNVGPAAVAELMAGAEVSVTIPSDTIYVIIEYAP